MKREDRAHALALLCAMTAAVGCAANPDEDAAVEHNKSMIQGYVDAVNKGDASYLDEYFAPDYVYHGPSGDLDLESFKQFHNTVLAAFPTGTMSVEDIIAAGDKVVTRWKFHGVQEGPFQGIAPTGKDVTVTGIIISRFENGKTVEEWEEVNGVSMMQQLGVIAGPETTTE